MPQSLFKKPVKKRGSKAIGNGLTLSTGNSIFGYANLFCFLLKW